MLLWFAGSGLALAWVVFRSPVLDYRLVVVGVLLPDLVDGVTGGAWVSHTLASCAALLGLAMVAGRGRRLRQRRLLAVPVGAFLHLLLDGVWSRTALFWWPAFGLSFGDGGLPSLGRPWPVLVAQEAAGALALAWAWANMGLGNPTARRRFLREGRLR
ncbi:MAG: hypothetical protein ACRD0M_05515 [Acidimicrobiales bacterium]